MSTTESITELDVDDVSPGDVAIPTLRAALADDENLVRDRAAAVCVTFADEDVEVVLPLLPAIITAARDENVNVALKAVTVLNVVAQQRPTELKETTETLATLLTHDLPRVQLFAAKAVQTIGAEHPEWFTSHPEPLLEALRADITDPTSEATELTGTMADPLQRQFAAVSHGEQFQQYSVQATAGNLLIEIADRDPAAIAPYAPAIMDALTAEDLNVVACAAEILGRIGQMETVDTAELVPPLVECLDSESEVVAARAITALGHIGSATAVEPLRSAAKRYDNGDLRELAVRTADWLDRERA
ncbi:HEAT repeat domain-containing protein [Halogeometricum borinquense]|uniref:HEAT repeat domain-containing protein n=1 Tax=Halogeometricum borinquense TaxID=60847 RepID=A0A6C0ULV4_9EURY|nr:HEAT repeat domain-containing protein [Halogeometricum borinquense]QIB73908.1 HEAT repeat domain-containing protein [Halogeometricum borinquense]